MASYGKHGLLWKSSKTDKGTVKIIRGEFTGQTATVIGRRFIEGYPEIIVQITSEVPNMVYIELFRNELHDYYKEIPND